MFFYEKNVTLGKTRENMLKRLCFLSLLFFSAAAFAQNAGGLSLLSDPDDEALVREWIRTIASD